MGAYPTSRGRSVDHCHLGEPQSLCLCTDHTPATIKEIRDYLAVHHRNAVEKLPPTARYNCIGHALGRSHGVFHEYEPFFTDDCTQVPFNSPAVGDVVRYERSCVFMHAAVVTSVSGGEISRVRSKWGYWSELSHRLFDVYRSYGTPSALLRPRPGVVSFSFLLDDRDAELPEPSAVGETGDTEMPDFDTVEGIIDWALGRISDPQVYVRMWLASTPESLRVIIEELPGVQELIDVGPPAAPQILRFYENARRQQEIEQMSIALYLMQRLPSDETKWLIAESLLAGELTGFNLSLAADAFLTDVNEQLVGENRITAALRAAKKLRS